MFLVKGTTTEKRSDLLTGELGRMKIFNAAAARPLCSESAAFGFFCLTRPGPAGMVWSCLAVPMTS